MGKKIGVFFLIILILIGGVIGGIALSKNNVLDNIIKKESSFVVTYQDKKINDTSLTLDRVKVHEFNVKGVKEYNVKIIPNETATWNYLKDNTEYVFKDIEDLTSAFAIEKQEDKFTITFDEDFSTFDVLETLYPDSEIIFGSDYEPLGYHFTIVISAEGKTPITADFMVFNTIVNGVLLDKSDIVILG